jgi:hypothetical protein
MKRHRHTPEQVVRTLREGEAGAVSRFGWRHFTAQLVLVEAVDCPRIVSLIIFSWLVFSTYADSLDVCPLE